MKRVLFTVYITGLMLIMACANGDPDEDVGLIVDAGEEDIQTLIVTNERLVQQLEKERDLIEQLKDRVETLEDENAVYKDDILTFKQQMIESEEQYNEELTLRNTLDEFAKDIFQAMHERNHSYLEDAVMDNITVRSSSEILETFDEENGTNYTFHYLSLNSVNYIRQLEFFYNEEESRFHSDYKFYTAGDKEVRSSGDVELIFDYVDDVWKLYSIKYKR